MEMFSGFPAFMASGDDEIRMTLASYLELVSGLPDEIVATACIQFSKRSTRFPPNRGEIFQRCEEIRAKQIAERKQTLRLAAPEREYSEHHREKMKARFADLLNEIRSAPEIDPKSEVLPGTILVRRQAVRTTPSSWLERWERENGRPYYNHPRAAE